MKVERKIEVQINYSPLREVVERFNEILKAHPDGELQITCEGYGDEYCAVLYTDDETPEEAEKRIKHQRSLKEYNRNLYLALQKEFGNAGSQS